MADFYALCVDLARVADALDGRTPLTSNQGQALDGYSALAEFRHVADRARAALTEPEPKGPTLDDIWELCEEHGFVLGIDGANEEESVNVLWEIARAVLARWGRPAPQPEPKGPTDEEIMELMPQQMREDLAAAARAITDQANTYDTRAKGIMRIILNRQCVDHARAVLARWGRPS